jgi:SAM-dependent methyltransferase
MSSFLRKAVRFGGQFIRSPHQKLAELPAIVESLRMRVRQDSTFRRPCDLEHASNCPARMLDKAIDMFAPASVLDVGCGTGKVLDYLLSRGIRDVYGLEGSELAIAASQQPALIRKSDLSLPVDLGRTFDLVYSVEVAEHIKPEAAVHFAGTCARHSNRVLFTAARPGQGGLGHLNEQEPAYWIDIFTSLGMRLDEPATAELKALHDLFHENLMVFVRP